MTCNTDSGEGEGKKKNIEEKELKRYGLPRWFKTVQGHESTK